MATKMSSSKSTRDARLHQSLMKYCPELEGSAYAAYPMQGDRWLQPNDKDPKTGEYLFQKSAENVGPKRDHVWGKGPYGVGYYSLQTKQPYTILYSKHMNTAPGKCCTGSGGKHEYDEWDDVRIILFQRMNSTRRNEAVAQSDMMGNASATANAHYQYEQNGQLLHHFVNNTTTY